MRFAFLQILLVATAAIETLEKAVARLEKDKAGCSACNLVAKVLDDAPLSMMLVKGWKAWSTAERRAELSKTLRRSCSRITQRDSGMEIRYTGRAGQRTFYDDVEVKKMQMEGRTKKQLLKHDTINPQGW